MSNENKLQIDFKAEVSADGVKGSGIRAFSQHALDRFKQRSGIKFRDDVVAKHYFPRAREAESIWHFRLKKYRKKGEWFELPQRVWDVVVSMIARGMLPGGCHEMNWEGLIEKCQKCSGRAYQGGWCFGCGTRMPKRAPHMEAA